MLFRSSQKLLTLSVGYGHHQGGLVVSTGSDGTGLNVSYLYKPHNSHSVTSISLIHTDSALLTGSDWANFTMSVGENGINLFLNGELAGSVANNDHNIDYTKLNFSNVGIGTLFMEDSKIGGSCGGTTTKGATAHIDNIALWKKDLGQTIPEPTTATLALLGIGALMLRRKRH